MAAVELREGGQSSSYFRKCNLWIVYKLFFSMSNELNCL
jgi:hypothetical protein